MRWPWRSGRTPPPILVDDGSLAVLASSFDPAAGEGPALAALAAAGHPADAPVLLRHLFALPDPSDAPGQPDTPAQPDTPGPPEGAGASSSGAGEAALRTAVERDGYEVHRLGERLAVTRQVVPTILAVAQERARMTGLETRLPVAYLGWQALAPPPARTSNPP
ncbi:hypothetical protein [Frankia sp. AvcI1]|uniref:hypothetical protein n=1 Tax=Frankia sp. AvcI1 TaxID=573496 RepID=UPI0006EC0D1F|nr:hypothetical protein [Frankia sp. AvcI1]